MMMPFTFLNDGDDRDSYRRRMGDPDGFFADAEMARPDPIGLLFVRWLERLADGVERLRSSFGRASWQLERQAGLKRSPGFPHAE